MLGVERHDAGRAVGAGLLAVSGLGATLAAAACCALPVVLATVGAAGGAWLLDVAIVAGPWQRVLLWGGVAALAAALFLARDRRGSGCAAGVCSRSGFRLPLLAIVVLGGGLAGLAFAIG